MRYALIIATIFLIQSRTFAQGDPVTPEINALLERFKKNESPVWTYQELADKSDVIVVATLIEKHDVAFDIVGEIDFDRDSIRRVSNKLKVLSVLKGETEDEIQVVTTEWKPKTIVLGFRTGFAQLRDRQLLPTLSAVEINGEIAEWGNVDDGNSTKVVPEYLLYLKKSERQNDFVPVTGQRWSAASIRFLNN